MAYFQNPLAVSFREGLRRRHGPSMIDSSVSNTKSHRWSSCLKPWNFCKSAEVFERERG